MRKGWTDSTLQVKVTQLKKSTGAETDFATAEFNIEAMMFNQENLTNLDSWLPNSNFIKEYKEKILDKIT